MAKLVYAMNVSLDGFVNTPDGSLDWSVVDDELHDWWTDFERKTDASMMGRRIYELMNDYWPTAESDPNATPAMLEFAHIWNPKPKIVFSHTLESVGPNSRLVAGDVGSELDRLKAEFDALDVSGPTLAAQFVERGLVDEYRLVIHPVVLGAGTPFFPRLDKPLRLRQVDNRVFASGVVAVGYVRA